MITYTSLEKPNLIALNKLIANWDTLQLTAEQRKPIEMQNKKLELLTLLKRYKKAVKNNTVSVTYEYSKNHFIDGRQYVKGTPSLQSMKRWMRHTLAGTRMLTRSCYTGCHQR